MTSTDVGIGWQARQVLNRAVEVTLDEKLSPREHAAALDACPDESFDQAGIGERLAGVELLVGRFLEDRDADRPVGWAVAVAAADWPRVSGRRPMPEHLLSDLSAAYLRGSRINLEPTHENFAHGLEMAVRPVVSGVALPERAEQAPDGRGYWALDYLVL